MSAAFHSHHQHHLEFRDIVKRRSCNISVGLDSPVQILLLAPLCIYSASLRKCSLILGAKQPLRKTLSSRVRYECYRVESILLLGAFVPTKDEINEFYPIKRFIELSDNNTKN